jgi:hypothetical protein
MTSQLLSMIDTVRAVRNEMRVWVHHLTGEGPATIRRQRESIAKTLPAAPLAPLTREVSAFGRFVPREAPTVAATPERRSVLVTTR